MFVCLHCVINPERCHSNIQVKPAFHECGMSRKLFTFTIDTEGIGNSFTLC